MARSKEVRDKISQKLKGRKLSQAHRITLSSAKLGNKNAVKLHTSELKQEAYRQYCKHLEDGNPKEAFCYDDPNDPDLFITFQTMDKYIKEDPVEFPPIKMERALNKRYQHWFNEGKTIMKGGYPGGSPVVWQTIMRNIFKDQKWDAKDPEQPQTASEPTRVIIAQLKGVDGSDA